MTGSRWLLVLAAVAAAGALYFFAGYTGAATHRENVNALSGIARPPARPQPQSVGPVGPSRAEEAIRRANEQGHFLFLCFGTPRDPATVAAMAALRRFKSGHPDRVETLGIDPADPSELTVLQRFDVLRAPRPFVVALGPGEVVTGAISGRPKREALRSALVGPGTLACLRALHRGKRVVLCVFSPATPGAETARAGVDRYLADTANALTTVRVELDPMDPEESVLLHRLGIDSDPETPATALIDPPATLRGVLKGATSKDALEKLRDSNCSTGCGPAG